MGDIIVLDEDTANRIAAGEVVERPASVVKELVENSLDAGATRISVDIKNGGISSIKVVDDGEGFHEDDAPMAFERYATSKLRSSGDLAQIMTLGFRGEALPSIASVSAVRLATRRRGSDYGRLLELRAGRLERNEAIGCPFGTSITVSDLFFNTPARYKFLKKDAAEAAQISDLTGRLAIGRPDISFTLTSQNAQILHTQGNGEAGDAIFAVLGPETRSGLVPVSFTQDHYAVTGFAGSPEIARANRNSQLFYVNGRFVKNRLLYGAVEEAYKSHLMSRRYPVVVLYIAMDASLVDVNAHPAKTEVRFQNEGDLFRAVYRGVEAALRGGGGERRYAPADADGYTQSSDAAEGCRYTPEVDGAVTDAEGRVYAPGSLEYAGGRRYTPDDAGVAGVAGAVTDAEGRVYAPEDSADRTHTPEVAEGAEVTESRAYAPLYAEEAGRRVFAREAADGLRQAPVHASQYELTRHASDVEPGEQQSYLPQSGPGRAADGAGLASARLIGQVFDTYVVFERGDELIFIDQHATHERVLYEKIKYQYENDAVRRQLLLESTAVGLLPDEMEFARDNAPLFLKAGIYFEEFGRDSIIVREAPMYLENDDVRGFFLDTLEILMSRRGANTAQSGAISSGVNASQSGAISGEANAAPVVSISGEALYDIACKAALKGNRRLSGAEAEELARSLDALPKPLTCPHGRPLVVTMSKRELDKKFKRIL